MEDIKKIIDKYVDRILSLDNVVGVGCGYKEVRGRKTAEECVVVLVEKKLGEEQLDESHIIPQSIEERKTDVIEVGKLELLSRNRLKRSRPAQPGMSIGHYKITAGTFGAVVKDKRSGKPLILSNNHVLANISNGSDGKAKKGDVILQPGSYDGGKEDNDVIGYLERFVPIYNDEQPFCPIMVGVNRVLKGFGKLVGASYRTNPMVMENKVDCAVATIESPDMVDEEILGIGKVEGIVDPKIGMRIQKSGRTTGLTSSRIKAIGATVTVQISASESAIFSDQIIADPFSQPGDSGSLVLTEDNKVVGLLFAGSDKSTICNRITNVLDALDITL
ncbi:hypothetical protein [Halonatronum saccharophilum]|uniref:hypothetical protein n=1 Tax=Halonatronum saccharophilum TaxID=150060 RepID=UPI0004807275|nr:hypothetical protein [Halonatronum saccharophilum]